MLSQSYQIFLQKIKTFYSRSKWLVILLPLIWCASCASPESPDVELTLSVQPTNRPSLYNVTGSTNLPEQSEITVTAIRYLRPTNHPWLTPDGNAIYSILDRQIVKVEQGQWQTELNLWQVAPDGRLQEAWQLNQPETAFSVNPVTEVSFLATFNPARQPPLPEAQEERIQELQGNLVRFTNEGQPYVQASETLQIALPVGRQPPPASQPEDINDGWGNRYELKEPPKISRSQSQPIRTNQTQTNAPLSPSEFLR